MQPTTQLLSSLRAFIRWQSLQQKRHTHIFSMCRNDELCVLYERAHVQEAQIAKGVVELQQKENEIRVLQLEVAELARSITATKGSLPNVEGIDQEVAALKVNLQMNCTYHLLGSPYLADIPCQM
jgi:hypothetical protein